MWPRSPDERPPRHRRDPIDVVRELGRDPLLSTSTVATFKVTYTFVSPMALVAVPMPPRLEGRGPTLATLHAIERILRDAEGPLSLNEIKRRLSAKAVRHAMVRQAVDEFKRLGFAVEGAKGVVWVLNVSPKVWSGKWRDL